MTDHITFFVLVFVRIAIIFHVSRDCIIRKELLIGFPLLYLFSFNVHVIL